METKTGEMEDNRGGFSIFSWGETANPRKKQRSELFRAFPDSSKTPAGAAGARWLSSKRERPGGVLDWLSPRGKSGKAAPGTAAAAAVKQLVVRGA